MYRLPVIIGAAALAVVAAGATALAGGLPTAHPATQAVSVPADGHATAVLEIASGTTVLSVGVADLGGTGGTLLRASTPDGAPVRPEARMVQAGGTDRSGNPEDVALTLASSAGRGVGDYAVTVTLNAAVTWRLDFAGGTQRTVANLRGGRVASVAFTAGSQVIDVTLPRPHGTVPVLLAGGASQLLLRAPAGVPVRVTAAGGAGAVSLDGATHTGVAGGSVFASPGWASATARYDVAATAGAANVAVTSWRG
jgi:hypothetical protein